LRHYSVLDGLPESDLLSLAPLGAKLFIGTRTRGLVAFDGERFESYRFADRTPEAISVLLKMLTIADWNHGWRTDRI
jgi:hypothetical protein